MTVIAPVPFSYGVLAGNTEIRHWTNSISSNLGTLGLVKTSDTGQINTATVTNPGTTNTVAGYEIWRFNDALQGTLPVYMKIEYGIGTSIGRPSIWLTVGQGSDGAGNLTGSLSTRTQRSLATTASTNKMYAHILSGTTSRLSAVFTYDSFQAGSNNIAIPIIVERTADATGRETADGVVISVGFGSCQVLTASGAGTQGNGPCLPLNIGPSTESFSVNTQTAAVGNGVVLFNGQRYYTISHVAIDSTVPPQANTIFKCTVLGTTRTYIVTNSLGGICYGNPTNVLSCILWE